MSTSDPAHLCLDADSIESVSDACPSLFRAKEAFTGDHVEMRYRHGTLAITQGGGEIFRQQVGDAASDGICSLECMMRAADIVMIDVDTDRMVALADIRIRRTED